MVDVGFPVREQHPQLAQLGGVLAGEVGTFAGVGFEIEEQLVNAVEQVFSTALPGGFLPERMVDVTPEK